MKDPLDATFKVIDYDCDSDGTTDFDDDDDDNDGYLDVDDAYPCDPIKFEDSDLDEDGIPDSQVTPLYSFDNDDDRW